MNEQAVSTAIDIDEAKKIIENSDKELVSAMLVSSGIRTCMTGYEYLKMAVQLYKACGGVMEEIKKVIGEIYSTNQAAIEKNMRKALKDAATRDVTDHFNVRIGCNVLQSGRKTIKAKEYVAMLAEYLEMPEVHSLFCLPKKEE